MSAQEFAILNEEYRFHYIFMGNPRKPVILFLHGFMGSWQDFQEVANLLQDNFYCLLIDLPGHGKTEVSAPQNYQMPQVAFAIINLLKHLQIKQCFLIGYSMGGRLALYLTIHFPQYFLQVVLESASPGLELASDRLQRIQHDRQIIQQLQNQDFSLFLEQWYRNHLFCRFTAHPNYQQAIQRRLDNEPKKLAYSLLHMGLGMQPSLWDQLKFIQPSTLLIVGELDFKFIAINQRINLLSPQFQIEIVENTDHNVHFERSLKFAQILEDFLENQDCE